MGYDLGGIISGALGGGAQAVQGMAQQDIETQNKASLMQQQQQAELDKEKAIEDYKVQIAGQQRQAQSQRINTGAAGIIKDAQNAAVNKLYSTPGGGGPVDPNDISDEERAGMPASPTDMENARIQAAEASGDIDPKTMALTSTRELAAHSALQRGMYTADQRAASSDNRTAGLVTIGAGHDKVGEDRVSAYKQRVAALGGTDRAAFQQARSLDADIRANQSLINRYTDQMSTAPATQRANYQQQIDALKADSVSRQTRRDAILAGSQAASHAMAGHADASADLDSAGTVGPPDNTPPSVQNALKAWQQYQSSGSN